MKQLGGADSILLAMESTALPQHVGALAVLDPSGAPDFGFEKLARILDARMPLAPIYTSKLRELPLAVDRAYLAPDPNFAVERHLHRIAVPSPGGVAELCELVGHLFARPLERDKPLWEMWFIEGLAEGRAGLLVKSHHCLMDGIALPGLAELLCDLEPNPAPSSHAAGSATLVTQDEGELRELDLAVRAVAANARRPLDLARLGSRLLRAGAGAVLRAGDGGRSFEDDDQDVTPSTRPPRASFNEPPGPRRSFACASVSLTRVRAIKKHFGVTVNDVLLALGAGAVRRYLEQRGELPDAELVVFVPVSHRADGDVRTDNQFTFTSVAWATDLADPVQRLQRIHRSAERAKHHVHASSDEHVLESVGKLLAPNVLGFVMRQLAPRSARAFLPANLVVSSVRATPYPLYLGGAKLESVTPLSALQPCQGLNLTCATYLDRVDFGFTLDPDQIPEPSTLAAGIEPALAELEERLQVSISTQSSSSS